MKILHRSVLATGIAVALVSQAPIVALADSSPINGPVNIEATNPQNESAETGPTQVTITVDGVKVTSENNDFTTYINTNGDSSANNNYGDATVTVNDNISASADQKALSVNCNATDTGSKTDNLTVVIDNKTVSSQTEATQDGATTGTTNVTTGTAIVADGTSNVVGSNTTIIGNVINNGEGDIVINARSNSNIDTVQANSTGDISIVGNVGDVVNDSDSGSVYISGDVEGTIYSNGTATTENANGVVIATGNVTVINDTISEDQIAGDTSNLFVYKVVDSNDANKTVDVNPHYIIMISGVDNIILGTPTTNNGSTTYDYTNGLNIVTNTASANGRSNLPASCNYADAGQTITFYVPDGYDHYFSVKADHIGGGQYVLTVPEGGGVTIEAWMKQVIEDTISSETGTPATIVDEDPSADSTPTYTGDIGSTDGIDFISTDAGLALPTTELGDAVVATLSVSLDMSKVTPVQFRDAVTTTIGRAPVGGVAVIETSEVATLDSNMIAAMQTRPDVEYVIVFKHDGFKKKVVIPAGYDYSLLLDENGYCGFLRLAELLGFTYLD